MKTNDLQQIVDISDRLKREGEARARKEAEEQAQKEELRRVYDAAQKKAVEEKARQEALRKLAENARREAEEKKADEELQDAIARNLAFGNKKGRKSAAELFAYMKIKLALMQKEAEEKERREGQGPNPLSEGTDAGHVEQIKAKLQENVATMREKLEILKEKARRDDEAKKNAGSEYRAADIEKALTAAALSGLPSETPARARRSRLPAAMLAFAALAIGGYAGFQFGVYRSKPSSELTTFLAEQADKATAENKKLREANSELSRKYAGIEAQLQTNSKEYAEKFQTLAGGLAEKYSNFDKDLANSLSELEKKSKEEMEKLNQFYKGRTAELEAKIAELEKKNTGYQKSNAEIESLKDERASLIRRMEELNTEILLYKQDAVESSKQNGELSDKVRQYENKDELAKKNKALEERVSKLEGTLRTIFGSVEAATEKLKEAEKSKSVAPMPEGRDPLAVDKDLGSERFGHLRYLQVSEVNLSGGTAADHELFEKIRKYEPHIAISDRCIEMIDMSCNQPGHKKLDEIPPELKSYQVRNVSLWGNKIKKLTNLEGARFYNLCLNRNEIEDTSGIKDIGEVKSLDLAYNKIRVLSGFENVNGMEELLVYGNPLDYNDPVTKKTLEALRAKGVKVIDKEPVPTGRKQN